MLFRSQQLRLSFVFRLHPWKCSFFLYESFLHNLYFFKNCNLLNKRCHIFTDRTATSVQFLLSQCGSSFSESVSSVQFSSVTQLCPTLCDPMNRSTTGLPVHHQLPELTQTHIHRVSDSIQPSHPLSSPSPPAPNLSQHQ